jgi:hypothetical protein
MWLDRVARKHSIIGKYTCQAEHQPNRGFLIVGVMRSGRNGLSKAALNL